jgi:aminoglycoside phosphotransferase (APT) family kinase protein
MSILRKASSVAGRLKLSAMPHASASAPFGSTVAWAAAEVACEAAGLDATGARLIRLGENALFHLPDPNVVVRVARSMAYWDDARREVAVARWLADQGFPAVRTFAGVAQPAEAAGRPVTFWEYIEGRDGDRCDIAVLAELLSRLHRLPRPDGFTLPPEDPLGRVRRRLEAASVTVSDRGFLLDRLKAVEAELPGLRFPLPEGPVHGDAHVQNLIVTAGGPVMIDFERFAWGHPEWDLSMTATEYQTAGWWTREEHAQFTTAYGFDVTSWEGYPVLRAAHELKMTSWLAQNIAESREVADEVAARIRTLRGQVTPGNWRPF